MTGWLPTAIQLSWCALSYKYTQALLLLQVTYDNCFLQLFKIRWKLF